MESQSGQFMDFGMEVYTCNHFSKGQKGMVFQFFLKLNPFNLDGYFPKPG